MTDTKIRVKLSAFDHRVLEDATKKLIQVALKAGGRVVGPVPLKTKHRVFVLRRSPFVYSKHGDKIQSSEHKRLIDIYNVNADLVNNLSTLTLPAGVDIVLETLSLENVKK
jgi:small subunit ribosomal protein S10